ncbi:MAG: hypothetical protein KDJ75_10165 [Alphaproteobacteria bacterium]|nr:hypothetical protein [Alphaproteobacteria bacterium]
MVAFRASGKTVTGKTTAEQGIRLVFGETAVNGCNGTFPAVELLSTDSSNSLQVSDIQDCISAAQAKLRISGNLVISDKTGVYLVGQKIIDELEDRIRRNEGVYHCPV